MGTDIHGYVEVRNEQGWKKEIDIGWELDRDYDMFGALFGVRNYADHTPLFPSRGIPHDYEDRDGLDEGIFHSETHVYLHELLSVNWNVVAIDTRVTVSQMGEYGWEELYKAAAGTDIPDMEPGDLPIIKDNRKYYLAENSLRDSVGERFFMLLERMEQLGVQHGISNVRMVVWFDS